MARIDAKAIGDAALEADHQVHEAAEKTRSSRVVKAIGVLSEIGDQPQLRLLCGGTVALGLWRSDYRMVGAGLRMLLAHECATIAKNAVKKRVDRRRPRNANSRHEERPRAGTSLEKELNSFPSGHSAGALAVASAFSAVYPSHRGPALLAAGAVAAAQVPRCAHYPSDVGVGLGIGAAAGGLVTFAWNTAGRALARALRR